MIIPFRTNETLVENVHVVKVCVEIGRGLMANSGFPECQTSKRRTIQSHSLPSNFPILRPSFAHPPTPVPPYCTSQQAYHSIARHVISATFYPQPRC